jgi:signal transduction histidine kinase
MATPSTFQTRRLSPWSPFSVQDLVENAPGIVRTWAESADPPRSESLADQVAWMLEGVGSWMCSDEAEIPADLKALFRDLAFAYRSEGCRLDQTLADLERLEDVLVGDGHDAQAPGASANRPLRRAMRALWSETIQLHEALNLRRSRERTGALETFGEILSHELGNRLGAARTGVDILRGAPHPLTEERRQDLLGLVGDGIDAALRTVDDVGAFVQMQRWVEDSMQPFHEVVAGLLQGLRPEARSRGVALRAAGSLPSVPVDAGRLRLILSNFLVNGIRYADLSREEPWVRLSARREEGALHVAVSDNGIGIPDEEQADVFQRHRRGRNRGERGGSGLGLTIASEAVGQLGGELRLESQVGEGTTIHVALPVDPDQGVVSAGASP